MTRATKTQLSDELEELPTLTDILEEPISLSLAAALSASKAQLIDNQHQQLELPLEPLNIGPTAKNGVPDHLDNSAHVNQTVERIQLLVEDLVQQYLPILSSQLTAELTKIVHDYLHNARKNSQALLNQETKLP